MQKKDKEQSKFPLRERLSRKDIEELMGIHKRGLVKKQGKWKNK